MLKKLNKQLPASRVALKKKVIPLIRKERISSPTRLHDPVAISKRINYPHGHFIIYPTPGGYRFALFCKIEKTDPFIKVAQSPKAYKLKSECIRTMKIMMDRIGDMLMKAWIVAFDHKGNKISLKIEYNIKMLL